MKTRSVTYLSRSWLVRSPFRRHWHHYVVRLRWPIRLLGWLATGGLASLAGWQYILLGPVAFEIVFMIFVALESRRVRRLPGPGALDDHDPRMLADRAEARRQAALPRVASPGGWDPPPGVRPAWNWTPPGGAAPRLNRVPLWARLWFDTPLVDRYAHAWLWQHGGYDVVPPEAWSPPPPSDAIASALHVAAGRGDLEAMSMPQLANLVCGSPVRNHDFDFARRALLDALYAAGDIRADVYNNYDAGTALEAGDLLVSYTSQVPVAAAQCEALRRYLERGGRWFAIHASNSVRDNPHLPKILGSRFIAHPPYTRYPVTVSRPDDPLMAGIDPTFEVDDELYVIEQHAEVEVLLETRWGGEAMSQSFPEAVRPLMYRHYVGDGGVLYLALGHCNRPFDVPRAGLPDAPDRRGPWSMPLYQELIRRGIDWAAGRRPR